MVRRCEKCGAYVYDWNGCDNFDGCDHRHGHIVCDRCNEDWGVCPACNDFRYCPGCEQQMHYLNVADAVRNMDTNVATCCNESVDCCDYDEHNIDEYDEMPVCPKCYENFQGEVQALVEELVEKHEETSYNCNKCNITGCEYNLCKCKAEAEQKEIEKIQGENEKKAMEIAAKRKREEENITHDIKCLKSILPEISSESCRAMLHSWIEKEEEVLQSLSKKQRKH